MFKRLLWIILALVVVAQFFQPDRSAPVHDPATDMLAMTNAPPEMQKLVIGACYDCHSYRTEYPWYAHFTPFSFLVQDHINEGREHLNFSLWDKYAGSEEAAEAGEEIEEGEMPPGYYRLMHGHGRLNDAHKRELIAWFAKVTAGIDGETGDGPEGERSEGLE